MGDLNLVRRRGLWHLISLASVGFLMLPIGGTAIAQVARGEILIDSAVVSVGFSFLGLIPVFVSLKLYRGNKQANRLLRKLYRDMEAGLDEIQIQTGFSPQDVFKWIAEFNARKFGLYTLTSDRSIVYDRRLDDEFIVVDQCPSCSKKNAGRFDLIQIQIPNCIACGRPFPAGFWGELKNGAKTNLREINLRKMKFYQTQEPPKINSVLLFLFPFLALILLFHAAKRAVHKTYTPGPNGWD